MGLAALAGSGLVLVALVWAFSTPPVPKTSAFSIDVDEIRARARALEGPLPTHLDVLEVRDAAKPRATVIGGLTLGAHRMPWTSFRIVSPAGTTLVDLPAHDDASAEIAALLERAVSDAARIVFTHEHPDHIGGLARLASHASSDAIVLWGSQAAAPEGFAAVPEEPVAAIAPGVVSIAAPGHTPGSRIIAVLTRSDRLFLLVGDIAWHRTTKSRAAIHASAAPCSARMPTHSAISCARFTTSQPRRT